MSYDNNFYKLYEDYLHEDSVRDSHNWMFNTIYQLFRPRWVLDLGCGKNMEFFNYGSFIEGYKGIDLNAEPPNIQADYRTFDYTDKRINEFTTVISLFSSEITAPYQENYKLYERIFSEMHVRNMVVSGFYYVSKKNQNPIGESGGVISYQTLENIEDVESSIFSEKRITLPVPSKLFGPDVIEVWKILERK